VPLYKRLGEVSREKNAAKEEARIAREELAALKAERSATPPAAPAESPSPAPTPTTIDKSLASPKTQLQKYAHYALDPDGNYAGFQLDSNGRAVLDDTGNFVLDTVPAWQIQQLQHAAWLEDQVNAIRPDPDKLTRMQSQADQQVKFNTRVQELNAKEETLAAKYMPHLKDEPELLDLASFLIGAVAHRTAGGKPGQAPTFEELDASEAAMEGCAELINQLFGRTGNLQLAENIAARESEAIPSGGVPATVDNKPSKAEVDRNYTANAARVLAELRAKP
jgi:hypothetical protein